MAFNPELQRRLDTLGARNAAAIRIGQARQLDAADLLTWRRDQLGSLLPHLKTIGALAVRAAEAGELPYTTEIISRHKQPEHRRHYQVYPRHFPKQVYDPDVIVTEGWSLTRMSVNTMGISPKAREDQKKIRVPLQAEVVQDYMIGKDGRPYIVEHKGGSYYDYSPGRPLRDLPTTFGQDTKISLPNRYHVPTVSNFDEFDGSCLPLDGQVPDYALDYFFPEHVEQGLAEFAHLNNLV